MRVPRSSLTLFLLAADVVAVGALAVLVVVSSLEPSEKVRAVSASAVAADAGGPPVLTGPPGGGPLLLVVNGTGPVDALAAQAAGSALRAPVLPVTTGSLTPSIRRALARLAPEQVVVIGGSDAVDDVLTRRLRAVTGSQVVRLAGENRFDTAAQVATRFFRPPVQRVLVTTGRELVSLPPGPGGQGPVLLVTPEQVPTETARALEALQPREIVVLPGADDASPALLAALEQYAPGAVRSGPAS